MKKTPLEKHLANNLEDYLVSLNRSIVSLAPNVGPVLAEAFTLFIPNQRVDRISDFVVQMDARLRHLEEADVRSRVKKYLPLIEEGFFKAARAATADRRSRIANLISRGITSEKLSEDKLLFLLDVLDQVNDAEIIQLGYYAQPTLPAKNAYESKYAEIIEKRFVYSGPNQQPARDRRTFQTAYKVHLARVGLLKERFTTTIGGSADVTDYELTDLGELLLEYVGL